RKIEEDSRFSAEEDRGRYSVCGHSAAKLSSFISFYLQSKQSLRKLSYLSLGYSVLFRNFAARNI
ncbi:MAG: hypothetical protein II404_13700, partial [Prevotella sp.]|nr:hypothetical protein [Prevotella sp.]